MADERVILNGIDATTGSYLFNSPSLDDLARWIVGGDHGAGDLKAELLAKKQHNEPAYSVGYQVDPDDLAQAGWGLLMSDDDPAIIEALRPLLEIRQEQAGDRYREFTGEAGLQAGDTKYDFLTRHKVGPGVVDPTRVPYYLLIVGDPERIDFRLQYQLAQPLHAAIWE